MRLLFRGHFACGHQVDERYHDKARSYRDEGRYFPVAARRIGQVGARSTTRRSPSRNYAARYVLGKLVAHCGLDFVIGLAIKTIDCCAHCRSQRGSLSRIVRVPASHLTVPTRTSAVPRKPTFGSSAISVVMGHSLPMRSAPVSHHVGNGWWSQLIDATLYLSRRRWRCGDRSRISSRFYCGG